MRKKTNLTLQRKKRHRNGATAHSTMPDKRPSVSKETTNRVGEEKPLERKPGGPALKAKRTRRKITTVVAPFWTFCHLAGLPPRLKNKIENLVSELSSSGFESVLLVVKPTSDWTAQFGSKLGQNYLQEKVPHAGQDFSNFCSENIPPEADDELKDIDNDEGITEQLGQTSTEDYDDAVNERINQQGETDSHDRSDLTGLRKFNIHSNRANRRQDCKTLVTEQGKPEDIHVENGNTNDEKLPGGTTCIEGISSPEKDSGRLAELTCVKSEQGFTVNADAKLDKSNNNEEIATGTASNKTKDCKVCGTSFSNNWSLRRHFRQFHTDTSRRVACKLCKKVFISEETLEKHLQVHKTARSKTKDCKVCGTSVSNSWSLERHFRQFHTDTSSRVACKLCKKVFISEETLEKHLQVHEMRYVCGIEDCTSAFTHSHLLDKHRLDTHKDYMNENRPFLCGVCGEGFLCKSSLNAHMEWKHPVEDPVECGVCHKSFRTRIRLRDHRRIHNASLRYICELCGMAYKSRSGLFKHRLNQHGSGQRVSSVKYRCDVCGKEYMRESTLVHHMVSTNHVTDNQSLDTKMVYECQDCGKKFGLKYKASRHMDSVHKRSMVCKCSFCGMNFTDKSNYKQHLRIHTGGKPTCEICKMCFRSHVSLTKHMDEAHSSNQKTHSEEMCDQETMLSVNSIILKQSALHTAEETGHGATEQTVTNAREQALLNSTEQKVPISSNQTVLHATEQTVLNAIEQTVQNAIEQTVQNAIEQTVQNATGQTELGAAETSAEVVVKYDAPVQVVLYPGLNPLPHSDKV